MGVKTIYIAGSPFFNNPWEFDGYSPHDLTLPDRNFGTIDASRVMVTDMHNRGMYVLLGKHFCDNGGLDGIWSIPQYFHSLPSEGA